MREVATDDIGKQIPLADRTLPERFFDGPAIKGERRPHNIPPPEGMPDGIGSKLWQGTTSGTISRQREWHVLAPGERIIMRIRATLDGRFLGAYHPKKTRDGHLRGIPADTQGELRKHADLVEDLATGQRSNPGLVLEPPIVPRVLDYLCASADAKVTYGYPLDDDPIVIERKSSTPSLPAVFWASMMTLAHLVWSRAGPGALNDTLPPDPGGMEETRHRLTLEDMLEAHRDKEMVERWRTATDKERESHRHHVLREAVRILRDPPPWKWWGGTMRQCAGWLERNAHTGTIKPISVRRWNPGERSGVRVAAWRFGAPGPRQASLFDDVHDKETR